MLAKTMFAATGGVLIFLDLLGHGDARQVRIPPVPNTITISRASKDNTPTVATMWYATAPAVAVQQD